MISNMKDCRVELHLDILFKFRIVMYGNTDSFYISPSFKFKIHALASPFFFFPERKKFLEARFEKSGPEEIQYQSEKEKQKDAFKQLRNQAAFLHYFTSCVSFRL